MTQRAGRWLTEQVGRCRRAVAVVAGELGCDWHTVNDTMIAYGQVLVEDPDRVGPVRAIGMDETPVQPYRGIPGPAVGHHHADGFVAAHDEDRRFRRFLSVEVGEVLFGIAAVNLEEMAQVGVVVVDLQQVAGD